MPGVVAKVVEIVDRRVFERTSRSIALTPAGETLLGYARRILEVRMGLSRDLRDELARKEFDAVIVRLAPRERDQAIWSEPQVWVAREGFEPVRGAVLPLALLPAPCVLRAHALESMKRLKRPWKVAFTGSSIVSVQAAVCAGLGISILPLSSLLPGMHVLPKSRNYPDPGRLEVGVLRGTGARADIFAALERVVRQTLDVLALARPVV